MKFVGASGNIKKFREKKGYTLREAASKLGIPFSTYTGYERYEQRRVPSDILRKIAELFDTSVEKLTLKNLTSNTPLIIHVDSDSKNERIAYVPFAAQAGYVKNYNDISYLHQLSTYSLPGFTNGTFRMFPVEGNSMIPTYFPGDILICRYIEQCNDIKDGECYVIVSTEGICVKRCVNALQKRGAIIINSDNEEFKPDIIPVESIREVWQPKAKITKT